MSKNTENYATIAAVCFLVGALCEAYIMKSYNSMHIRGSYDVLLLILYGVMAVLLFAKKQKKYFLVVSAVGALVWIYNGLQLGSYFIKSIYVVYCLNFAVYIIFGVLIYSSISLSEHKNSGMDKALPYIPGGIYLVSNLYYEKLLMRHTPLSQWLLPVAIVLIIGTGFIFAGLWMEPPVEPGKGIEQRKLEGDLTVLSPEERKYAEMYRVMSGGAFANAYNTQAIRLLHANESNNRSTSLLYEGRGALFVKNERDYSHDQYPLGNFCADHMEEAILMMDKWEENCYPADQINEVVTKELKRILTNANDQNNMKFAMDEIYGEFDSICRGETKTRNERGDEILDEANARKGDIVTTGLDYGIITNSAANLALYDILDAKEHKKQQQQQESVISAAAGVKQSSAGISQRSRIMTAYHKYMYKAKKIVALSIKGNLE